MSLKYVALCTLLLFILIFVGIKNYDTWTHPIEWSPEERVAKKAETKTEMLPNLTSPKEPPSVAPSILIAGKNIFSPERKDFPILPTDGKKSVGRPQIVLYGVTISGNYQAASLAIQGRPLQKNERETVTIKLGEKIGEYKLAKVSSDRITLQSEEDSFEVLLYDPKMPKKRLDTKTESKPATITSTAPVPTPVPKPPPAEAPRTVPGPVPIPIPTEKPQAPPPQNISPSPLPTPMVTEPPSAPPSTSSPNAPTVYPGRSRRPPYMPTRPPIQQGGS